MKIKLRQINDVKVPLSKLIALDIPVKAAFKLSRIIKEVDSVFVNVEEQRVKLVKKYGTPAEGGGMRVPPENIANFSSEYNVLLDEEIELNITPVSLDSLGDIKLTALDLLALELFITTE